MTALSIRWTSRGCTILLLYVDDMIISGNDVVGISVLKTHLMRTFNMKDLVALTYFLGLEVSRNKDGICIHQRKYAVDLINFACLGNAKTFDTPFELTVKIRKDESYPLEDPTVFRHLVGSLLYLTMTRLDISHAVHTLSLSAIRTNLILLLFIAYYGILRELLIVGSSIHLLLPCSLQLMRILIRLVVRTLEYPPRASACFLVNP